MNRDLWIIKKGVQVGLILGVTPLVYAVAAAWAVILTVNETVRNEK